MLEVCAADDKGNSTQPPGVRQEDKLPGRGLSFGQSLRKKLSDVPVDYVAFFPAEAV